MTSLENRVEALEVDMQSVKETLDQVARQQQVNAAQQQATNDTLERLSQRLDSYIYESQRIQSRLSERTERLDAAMENMVNAVARLTQATESDRAEFRSFRQQTQSMIDRLDALVNYLMRSSD